jgi:hypothetical protein
MEIHMDRMSIGSDCSSEADSDAETVLEMLGRDAEESVYIAESVENMFAEKVDRKYYVGIAADDATSGAILDIAVSPSSFFAFPATSVIAYLRAYSTHECARKHIDIMQLVIVEGTYTVVVKTTWLKTIQRKWRSIRPMSQ